MRSLGWAMVVLFAFAIGAARAEAPQVPDEEPLTAAEIRALIHGVTYDLVAYDQPLTGVTTWNFETGIVSGSYVWDKKDSGTFAQEMYIEDDKLCTKQQKGDVCQIVYRYQDGFMEVTPAGVVHAVSLPKK